VAVHKEREVVRVIALRGGDHGVKEQRPDEYSHESPPLSERHLPGC